MAWEQAADPVRLLAETTRPLTTFVLALADRAFGAGIDWTPLGSVRRLDFNVRAARANYFPQEQPGFLPLPFAGIGAGLPLGLGIGMDGFGAAFLAIVRVPEWLG